MGRRVCVTVDRRPGRRERVSSWSCVQRRRQLEWGPGAERKRLNGPDRQLGRERDLGEGTYACLVAGGVRERDMRARRLSMKGTTSDDRKGQYSEVSIYLPLTLECRARSAPEAGREDGLSASHSGSESAAESTYLKLAARRRGQASVRGAVEAGHTQGHPRVDAHRRRAGLGGGRDASGRGGSDSESGPAYVDKPDGSASRARTHLTAVPVCTSETARACSLRMSMSASQPESVRETWLDVPMRIQDSCALRARRKLVKPVEILVSMRSSRLDEASGRRTYLRACSVLRPIGRVRGYTC